MINLFDLPEIPLSEELSTILTENSAVKIERIISTGQTSDWYDQEETEFVALLQGEARLEYENGEFITMKSGGTLIIPPHKLHRVCYTSSEPPCVWLCVFWK